MRLLPSVLIAVSALGLTVSAAHAADKCPYHPRDTWIPIDQAISKAEALGYDVRDVEADDGCWEVEGYDRNGAKVKVYLDPVSGDVVKPSSWLSRLR
jgi:hypothetical protein